MRIRDGYSWDMEKSVRENMSKLKELIINLNNCDNELEKGLYLVRTYPTIEAFNKAFYLKGKFREEFNEFKDQVETIEELYTKYQESGFADYVRTENKFLLKDEGNLDARYIVNAYINDFYSYDLDKFYKRYRITRDVLITCLNRVKAHAPELYEQYLKTVEDNKTKRLVMPIMSVNSIIEGINTGKTSEGKKFDVFEFYKIAPFLDKDFDLEIKTISKDFPKLEKFKILKRDLRRSDSNKNGQVICSYADNLYLFAKCFSETQAETLRTWMEENKIKNLTPIHRATTVNVYAKNEDFTVEDANSVFDTIEEVGYPKTREVFELLKEQKINSKKNKELVYEIK